MPQSKAHSAIEQATHVFIKAGTATLLWLLIRPHAMQIPALGVTAIFMVNSFVLGYAIRRCYNKGEAV